MISPCKKCINHSRIFPVCFDNCKSIEEFKRALFYTPIEVVEEFEDRTQTYLYKYEGIYRPYFTKTSRIKSQIY